MHTHACQCTGAAVLQRAEDPETQAGFYETFNGNRTHHVLALPRDAQGRKLQTTRQTGRRGKNKASYWRLVRPASGFSDKDMSYDGVWTPQHVLSRAGLLKSQRVKHVLSCPDLLRSEIFKHAVMCWIALTCTTCETKTFMQVLAARVVCNPVPVLEMCCSRVGGKISQYVVCLVQSLRTSTRR